MTDQQMHERLQAAGARFREQTAAPTGAAGADELLPRADRRRSGVLVAVAAAAVVLLVAGLVLGLRGAHRPAPPSADNAGLVGTVWLVSPDVRPSTAALYISRSGQLVADDECRLIGGTARVAGDRLTVTDVSLRPKPCTDQYGAGFYEQGTRVLQGSATFHIDNRGLTITRAGVGSLHFVPAQSPIPPPSLDVPTLTGADWVAPNGSVLHIDPTTGQLSGGWCGGRAVVVGADLHFTDCSRAGRVTYLSVLSGTTLRLQALHDLSTAPPAITFSWRPPDPSMISFTSVVDRSWHLQSVNGEPASSGSLQFTRDTAVIDDGCATYRRAVNVGAGTLTISGPAPAYACNDQASTADSFLFNDQATWLVRDGKLIVYGGGSQTLALVYTSSGPIVSRQDPAALLAHPWQVATIRFGSGAYAHGAPTADPAALTFTDTGYRLAHTCYYVDGLAQRGQRTIVFHKGAQISHSCPRPQNEAAAQQAATAVDTIVAGQVRWSVDGGELTLTGNGGTLVLRAAGAGPPPAQPGPSELTGSSWRLTGTASSGASRDAVGVVVLSFPSEQTLLLQRCYDSRAAVTVHAGSLDVRYLRTTLARPCPSGPPGTQQQNALIDSALNGTVTWGITGDRLTLSRAGKSLTFLRRP